MKKKNAIGIFLIAAALIVGSVTLLRVKNIQDSGLALSTEAREVLVSAEVTAGYIASQNKPVGTPAPKTNLPEILSIPGLGINAPVQHLGITESGNMAAPANFTDVSWYKYGTIPGATGSAVMAGHDNGIYVRGVFLRLNELKVGDDVYVTNEKGKKLHFKVIETTVYPYDKAPLEKIFNRSDGVYLNLITCTGTYVKAIGSSDHRIVVYTKLVE